MAKEQAREPDSSESKPLVWGPTFQEMLEPWTVREDIRAAARLAVEQGDELDPVNLFNIHWRHGKDTESTRQPEEQRGYNIDYFVLPEALTGVDTPIVVIFGKDFPTGSHKVGATYSVAAEDQAKGDIRPGKNTLVWPSTGNYGIGGAWVGPRMGYESVVVLPAGMSRERFEKIEGYGAQCIRTPGSESNVKEIYDQCRALREGDPNVRVENQFEAWGNYLFHNHVTGNTIADLVLQRRFPLASSVRAFVSAMGSAGTIAAGDRLKQVFKGETRVVGLEPVQCPTLYNNGFGEHDIQGIGDKHVPWIHNTDNMDALMAIDDQDCLLGLQFLTSEAGQKYLIEQLGIPEVEARRLSTHLGISGVCNILGAIKTAKFFGFGSLDPIVTVATDSIDRYHSVVAALDEKHGPVTAEMARARLDIFHRAGLDWIQEGTRAAHDRWANLKYFTWVEQQGKTAEELRKQRSPDYWKEKQDAVTDIDAAIRERRGF